MSDFCERLNRAAKQSSDILRQMAEAKSLRQAGNPEGRTDLYMWPTPEQTIEGQAAAHIARLTSALDDLQQAEAEYRLIHDRHGDGSQAAGRAWDLMRRVGDKARELLNECATLEALRTTGGSKS